MVYNPGVFQFGIAFPRDFLLRSSWFPIQSSCQGLWVSDQGSVPEPGGPGLGLVLCVISWLQALSGTGQEPGQEFLGPEDPRGWCFGILVGLCPGLGAIDFLLNSIE